MGDVEEFLERINRDGTHVSGRAKGHAILIEMAKYSRIKQVETVVSKLLENPNYNVNQTNIEGTSPLIVSVTFSNLYSSLKVVDLLLAHPKIKVNQYDNDGWSALHWACDSFGDPAHTEALYKLLAHPDIDVNAVSIDGETALYLVCEFWNDDDGLQLEIVKALLAHPNINVNVVTKTGCSCLSSITSLERLEKKPELFDLFIEHPNICIYNALKRRLEEVAYSEKAVELIITRVCDRLRRNTFSRLRFPNLSKLPSDLLDKLKNALKDTKRLTHLDMDEEDPIFTTVALANASITSFASKKTFLNGVVERNLNGYKKCKRAVLYAMWFLKPILKKDCAMLIVKQVWESRGTRTWFY